MKKFTFLIIILLLMSNCSSRQNYKIKVMTYNVRHGVSMSMQSSMQQQAEIIKKENPDWVGLQEIDKTCKRSNCINQTEKFADLTGYSGFFGKFMDYDSGEYGMATLSQLSIIKSETLQLPEGAEPRVAILQIVEIAKNIQLLTINIHLDWTSSEYRLPQVKTLMEYIEKMDIPTIIIGDYNAEPGSPTLQLFQKYGFSPMQKNENHLTWEATNPTKELDHVFYRGTNNYSILPNSIEVLNEPEASDHRPVVAELTIKKR